MGIVYTASIHLYEPVSAAASGCSEYRRSCRIWPANGTHRIAEDGALWIVTGSRHGFPAASGCHPEPEKKSIKADLRRRRLLPGVHLTSLSPAITRDDHRAPRRCRFPTEFRVLARSEVRGSTMRGVNHLTQTLSLDRIFLTLV
jgi:hypothetical protein